MKISIFDQEKEIFAIIFKEKEEYKSLKFVKALLDFLEKYH